MRTLRQNGIDKVLAWQTKIDVVRANQQRGIAHTSLLDIFVNY